MQTEVDWEAAAKYYSEARQPQTVQECTTVSTPPEQVNDGGDQASEGQQQKVRELNGQLTGKKRRTFTPGEANGYPQTDDPSTTAPEADKGASSEEHPGGDDDKALCDGASCQNEDALSSLLKKVDQNPHDYEASHQLVAALALTDRVDEYEAALKRMLREFPLLFGYWKKLGKLYIEKKRSWPQVEQVLERACEYVGHNPMIWVAYLQWVKDSCCMTTEATRITTDRALECTALDFEEEEYKQACAKVAFTGQTDTGLNTEEGSTAETLQGENKEALSKHALQRRKSALQRGEEAEEAARHVEIIDLLIDEELLKLRSSLLKQKKPESDDEQIAQADVLNSEHADGPQGLEGIREEVSSLGSQNAVEEACWAIRQEHFARTTEQARKCKAFENGVHRWFWHPDPLTPQRLEAWRDYLDHENQRVGIQCFIDIERGDKKRKVMLQKRCLEVCASYLEFWQRFACELKEANDPESALQLLHRGAYKVMPRRRDFALAYALLAEELQKFVEAAEAYNRLLEPPLSPAYLKYYLAWIDFKRRRGELDRVLQLYDEGMQRFASHQQCCELLHLLKAKFLFFVQGDLKASISCLTKAVETYPQNGCLLQLLVRFIETKYAGHSSTIVAFLSTQFADSLKNPEVNVWTKWQIWKMYVHVLYSYAEDVSRIQAAKADAFHFLRSNRTELMRAAPDAFRLQIPEALRTETSVQMDDGKNMCNAGAQITDNSMMTWNNTYLLPGYEDSDNGAEEAPTTVYENGLASAGGEKSAAANMDNFEPATDVQPVETMDGVGATAYQQALQHQLATGGGAYDGYNYWEAAAQGARATGYYNYSEPGQGSAAPSPYYITAASTASSTPSLRSRASV